MYCLLGGRVDWQKVFWKSPYFGVRWRRTVDAIKHWNSSWDITGAKQSCLIHVRGSKLPNTTILYIARMGFPSASFLMVEIAMMGNALPVIGRRSWYYFSVMYSHVWVSSVRPKYSLRYALSQIDLSFGVIVLWSLREGGGDSEVNGDASTWARFPLMKVWGGRVVIYCLMAVVERSYFRVELMKYTHLTMTVSISWKSRRSDRWMVVFHPDSIFLLVIRMFMLLCSAGMWSGLIVCWVRPTWNIHSSFLIWR